MVSKSFDSFLTYLNEKEMTFNIIHSRVHNPLERCDISPEMGHFLPYQLC